MHYIIDNLWNNILKYSTINTKQFYCLPDNYDVDVFRKNLCLGYNIKYYKFLQPENHYILTNIDKILSSNNYNNKFYYIKKYIDTANFLYKFICNRIV